MAKIFIILCMLVGLNLALQQMCSKGFTLRNSTCVPCSSNQFKSIAGNHTCSDCDKFSYSNKRRSKCICYSGYYRIYRRHKHINQSKCYDLKPQHLVFTDITSNSVLVKWEILPVELISKIGYLIRCNDGKGKHILYTVTNSILLTDLNPNTVYSVAVVTDNRLINPSLTAASALGSTTSLTVTGYFVTKSDLPDYSSIIIALIIPIVVLIIVVYIARNFFNRRSLGVRTGVYLTKDYNEQKWIRK